MGNYMHVIEIISHYNWQRVWRLIGTGTLQNKVA